jgi:hypothetical protein
MRNCRPLLLECAILASFQLGCAWGAVPALLLLLREWL